MADLQLPHGFDDDEGDLADIFKEALREPRTDLYDDTIRMYEQAIRFMEIERDAIERGSPAEETPFIDIEATLGTIDLLLHNGGSDTHEWPKVAATIARMANMAFRKVEELTRLSRINED